jgi:hypothetical protein
VWVGAGAGLAVLLAGALVLLRREAPVRPAAAPARDTAVVSAPSSPVPPVQQDVAEARPDSIPLKAPPPRPAASAKRTREPIRPRTQRPSSAVPPETLTTPALAETPASVESLSTPEPAATPTPPPVAAPTPPVETTKAAAPPSPPPARPADIQREVNGVLARYARAIESNNLDALRQVYPGMTQPQQRGWEQFFQLVRDVKADLSVGQLQLTGGGAEAQVTGTYSYQNTSTGRAERQPVSFHATFRENGGRWEISQVR